jgi:predicted DNA-binding transcriptional regulator AlpA
MENGMLLEKRRVLRLPEVVAMLGVCRDTVYVLVRNKKLKPPLKLAGGKASGWFVADIEEYLSGLAAARDGGAK